MEQITLQLTGGNNNGTRRALDYYPTPANVTLSLIKFLQLPTDIKIWEPACGDGAMSKVFEKYGYSVISSDINDVCYGIPGADFTTTDFNPNAGAIVTNPPFNLSEQFITKALEKAPIVAMLLKSQYWHAAKRYTLFQKFKPKYVLPLTWRPDFLEHERTDGKKGAPTMEVCWTVWDRSYCGSTIYNPLVK